MKVFTVHEPPEAGSGRLEGVTLVKEGFCWPALFIPAIWMLWHRMWWVLLGWLAIGVGLTVIGEIFARTGFVVGILSFVFSIWFALEANELRRWSLARKGWRMLGVAAGRDDEEAEQSFFRRVLTPAPTAGSAQRSVPARPPVVPRRPSGGSEPVVGLFPHPE
ncbi:DUF2628 domain-containing protein [Microbaculum marinum]|uniref:DUF2628 domain-containing protein n=1 Tax=Microbaculum marinum TaxID=1764581 RepID=A0AAW9S1C0_9HYPH